MKTILAVLLFCASLFGQSQSMPEPDKSGYSLTLTVISAQRTTQQGGYTTTHIIGYMSDDAQRAQLHMVCDAGIFSRGPDGKANTYPARYSDKSHQIKIQTREMGSDKIHEHTCKW